MSQQFQYLIEKT